MLRELGGIGNNINQIARPLNFICLGNQFLLIYSV
ncbi:plasmid mobilization relaxosome protein MobC [Acinetobacter pittii]